MHSVQLYKGRKRVKKVEGERERERKEQLLDFAYLRFHSIGSPGPN